MADQSTWRRHIKAYINGNKPLTLLIREDNADVKVVSKLLTVVIIKLKVLIKLEQTSSSLTSVSLSFSSLSFVRFINVYS